MKSTLLFLLHLGLLGVTHVSAQSKCRVGSEKEVIPGYSVEFECGIYREGKRHENIANLEACAQICKSANSPYCSYSPPQKTCIVGSDIGKMGADSTMYYMKRLQGDEEYPDPPTHEDELTGELSTCKAGLDDCDKGKRGPLQNAFKDSISSEGNGEIRFTQNPATGNWVGYRMACDRGMNGPVYDAPDTQTLRACLESCSADGNKCQGADWHKVSKKCAKKGKADWANSRQDSNYNAFYKVGWVKKA
ncbi:hypothetical protein N7533_001820 [Penicillium manginii]|uniref:uncharacterized protein n=1 Tax=Penicillium manginii TaxID=203109 RepID=UPI0025483551|nr:uncharacterized protein N7533_001820 [Penicillium manginii]KAJ5763139.1 hypothetical protein N7533_001820 [Penicillium manginii]